MAKLRIAGRLRWAGLLALSLASGCTGTPHAQAPPHDPLHGVLVPPGIPQPTYAPKADGGVPTTPQAFNPGGVPATPASMSSSNPATLAGTSWQGPLGRPTALDDSGPPFLPGQSTLGSKTPQVPGPNANPKVEAVPDNTPSTPPIVTPTASWQTAAPVAPGVNVSQPSSAAILAKQLQDRGVINQKQDAVPEGIHLTCYLSRGPEAGLRILEVTAVDYSSAAQAILQQLDASR